MTWQIECARHYPSRHQFFAGLSLNDQIKSRDREHSFTRKRKSNPFEIAQFATSINVAAVRTHRVSHLHGAASCHADSRSRL